MLHHTFKNFCCYSNLFFFNFNRSFEIIETNPCDQLPYNLIVWEGMSEDYNSTEENCEAIGGNLIRRTDLPALNIFKKVSSHHIYVYYNKIKR